MLPCNQCSSQMVMACSHEFGEDPPPCASKHAEAPSASANTGSPKLPSEDDVWQYIRYRKHASHWAVAKDTLEFIARQLRVGA